MKCMLCEEQTDQYVCDTCLDKFDSEMEHEELTQERKRIYSQERHNESDY